MEFRNKKILIVSPHPDDELISSFHILSESKGRSKLRVVFLTNGEANTICKLKVYRNPFLTRSYYGKIRKQEALNLMKALEIQDFKFLEFPDGRLELFKNGLLNKLKNEMENFRPEIVISPSMFDRHKDHNIAGLAIYLLSEVFSKVKFIYYVIHGDEFTKSLNYNVKFKLDKGESKLKDEYSQIYRSQILCNKSIFKESLNEEKYLERQTFEDQKAKIDYIGENLIWLRLAYNLNPLSFPKVHISRLNDGISDSILSLNQDYNRKVNLQKLTSNKGYLLTISKDLIGKNSEFSLKLSDVNPIYDKIGYRMFKIKPTKHRNPKTVAVIPCYNIARLCEKTAEKCLNYVDSVVVVDDGSTDDTENCLKKLSNKNLHVIRLKNNMGKGKALLAGMEFALENIDFDLLITMDGDMQHRPKDIIKFKKAWMNGAEAIFGIREGGSQIPLRSKIGHSFINRILSFLLKMPIADSQSGFRGFDRKLLTKMVKSKCIKFGRYETELDMFLYPYIKNARVLSVEIPFIYLENNASSHFNPILDSVRILKELVSFKLRCRV